MRPPGVSKKTNAYQKHPKLQQIWLTQRIKEVKGLFLMVGTFTREH